VIEAESEERDLRRRGHVMMRIGGRRGRSREMTGRRWFGGRR
jgi:hypothetical protein